MSSKRNIRKRKCFGKQRFANQTKAVASMVQLRKSGKLNGNISSYKCKFCKGWHFGHHS